MATTAAQPWVFTQIGPPRGGQPLKVLTLEGVNAPFGRARHGAIYEAERELDETEVRYPGNRVPTRHIFTDHQNGFTLSGRFQDDRIGTVTATGGALAKAEEVDAFVADAIPCRIQWGARAWTGLLVAFKQSPEDEANIGWTLRIKIDTDDTKAVTAPGAPRVNAAQSTAEIGARLALIEPAVTTAVPEDVAYSPGFLDQLSQVVSDLNSYSAALADVAARVDAFQDALSLDVAQLRAGIAQFGTAADRLQILLATADSDLDIAQASAFSQTQWAASRADVDVLLFEVLAILAETDLAAEQAQKGTTDTTIRAGGGDTWESIATTYLGSAGRADDLRQANGVRYGTPPRAGQIVHIPKG